MACEGVDHGLDDFFAARGHALAAALGSRCDGLWGLDTNRRFAGGRFFVQRRMAVRAEVLKALPATRKWRTTFDVTKVRPFYKKNIISEQSAR
jgi:hypothetical protein